MTHPRALLHPTALDALDAAGIGRDPDALRGAVERLAEEVARQRTALYEVMDTLGALDKRTNAYKALEIAKQAVYGTGPR